MGQWVGYRGASSPVFNPNRFYHRTSGGQQIFRAEGRARLSVKTVARHTKVRRDALLYS